MVQVASHNPRGFWGGGGAAKDAPRKVLSNPEETNPVMDLADQLSWDFLGGKKLGFDTFHLTQHLMISDHPLKKTIMAV